MINVSGEKFCFGKSIAHGGKYFWKVRSGVLHDWMLFQCESNLKYGCCCLRFMYININNLIQLNLQTLLWDITYNVLHVLSCIDILTRLVNCWPLMYLKLMTSLQGRRSLLTSSMLFLKERSHSTLSWLLFSVKLWGYLSPEKVKWLVSVFFVVYGNISFHVLFICIEYLGCHEYYCFMCNIDRSGKSSKMLTFRLLGNKNVHTLIYRVWMFILLKVACFKEFVDIFKKEWLKLRHFSINFALNNVHTMYKFCISLPAALEVLATFSRSENRNWMSE